MAVDAELVRKLADELASYRLGERRAGELALEIRSLQEAMREMPAPAFDDEPAAFLAFLEARAR